MDETGSSPLTDASKPRVAVVFGGRSSEHAISCVTAAGVMQAIDRDRYDVVPVGVTRAGRWVLVPDDPKAFELTGRQLPQVPADAPAGVLAPQSTESQQLTVLEAGQVPKVLGAVDVVFPLLHGPYGEDGTVQGMLELTDTRYVGAGVLSSALGMDKHYTKLVLASQAIPVAPYVLVRQREWESDPAVVTDAVGALGWPVFVKPARAGSSMGITRVERPEDLGAAIAAAQQHDPKVLVEGAVEGREIECGVLQSLDGGAPDTSLPGEIRVLGGHDFYDFEAKYLDEGNVQLECPARLTDGQTDAVRDLAGRTFDALACEGLARVDFFLADDGRLLVNEVNTMPGFTPFSMFPRMWACTGLAYPDLVDRLIQQALRRPTGLR